MSLQQRLAGLDDLLPRGTARSRRWALMLALTLLAAVDAADLLGILHWALSPTHIGWVSLAVTLAVYAGIEGLQEVRTLANRSAMFCLVGLSLAIWTVTTHPDAGAHYMLFATPSGILTQAVLRAWAWPTVCYGGTAVFWIAWEWFQDYRRLRATTPEERANPCVDLLCPRRASTVIAAGAHGRHHPSSSAGQGWSDSSIGKPQNSHERLETSSLISEVSELTIPHLH